MDIKYIFIKYHKILLVLIGLTLITFLNPFRLEKRSLKRFYSSEIRATVVNKYFTIKERRRRFIILSDVNSLNEFNFFTPNENTKIYDLVELGDTIIKSTNSFEINIKNYNKDIKINVKKNSEVKFRKDK